MPTSKGPSLVLRLLLRPSEYARYFLFPCLRCSRTFTSDSFLALNSTFLSVCFFSCFHFHIDQIHLCGTTPFATKVFHFSLKMDGRVPENFHFCGATLFAIKVFHFSLEMDCCVPENFHFCAATQFATKVFHFSLKMDGRVPEIFHFCATSQSATKVFHFSLKMDGRVLENVHYNAFLCFL